MSIVSNDLLAKSSRGFNRLSVQSALRSLKAALTKIKVTPKNGLAMFFGKDISIVLAELPQKLDKKLYLCDNRFHTEHVHDLLQTATEYLYLIVSGSHYSLYSFGNSAQLLFEKLVTLPNKHNNGGQSQNRYQRLRKEAVDLYIKQVIEKVTFYCSGNYDFAGMVIAGPANLKNKVADSLITTVDIVATITTSHHGRTGFDEALTQTVHMLDTDLQQEVAILTEFYDLIAKDDPKYTFGKDETITALSVGMVGTLLISDEYQELATTAEEFGSEYIVITDRTAIGRQFITGFGGVAAILRYTM